MRSFTPYAFLLPLTFAVTACVSNSIYAGVVTQGTRVIFEAGQNEKSLQLNNRDKHPNIVQIWTDSGVEDSSPEHADGPFLANPQMFKMNAQQGQVVRLKFIGIEKDLAQDRESLFYLNINEIPAIKSADLEANRLVVSFTNRLKILYRPKKIEGNSADVMQQVRYQIKPNSIQLHNPTAFYAHISKLQLIQGETILASQQSIVIPPKTEFIWTKPKGLSSNNVRIDAVFINDYGAGVPVSLQQR